MIVKLQRPLSSPNAAWLVSDRNRSINEFIAVGEIPSWLAKAMDGHSSGYFNAAKDDTGRWIFGAAVKASW